MAANDMYVPARVQVAMQLANQFTVRFLNHTSRNEMGGTTCSTEPLPMRDAERSAYDQAMRLLELYFRCGSNAVDENKGDGGTEGGLAPALIGPQSGPTGGEAVQASNGQVPSVQSN